MNKEFFIKSVDGTDVFVYKWEAQNQKAVVQIAHGAVEHAMRYEDFAKELAANGYTVYANDHRGHGKTAGCAECVGYYSDKKGGFNLAVEDLYQITRVIKQENPKLDVFLLGHSMGSLMARVYASRYGSDIKGLVLTGTGRVNPVLIGIVRFLAKLQIIFLGRKHKSPFLHSLVFGTLNRPFKGETGSEFICSDQAVIDKYASDEFCGNTVTAEFVYELLWGTNKAAGKKTFAAIPKELPVFIGAGEYDTMGGKNLSEVKKDAKAFSKQNDFTFKTYIGMRHEILNEKDKKTVYNDIIEWLQVHA